MKSNHKNFAKWSAKKAAIAEKKAEIVIDVEEEEVFIFNSDTDAGLTDVETAGLIMDLPQIQPPVETTGTEEPAAEIAVVDEAEAPILVTAPIETAFFEI